MLDLSVDDKIRSRLENKSRTVMLSETAALSKKSARISTRHGARSEIDRYIRSINRMIDRNFTATKRGLLALRAGFQIQEIAPIEPADTPARQFILTDENVSLCIQFVLLANGRMRVYFPPPSPRSDARALPVPEQVFFKLDHPNLERAICNLFLEFVSIFRKAKAI